MPPALTLGGAFDPMVDAWTKPGPHRDLIDQRGILRIFARGVVSTTKVSKVPAGVEMVSSPTTFDAPVRLNVIPSLVFIMSTEDFQAAPTFSGSCTPLPSCGEYLKGNSCLMFHAPS